ncbi:uncharacterized protein LOC144173227 [Haemaphysalis longicornis]
MFALEAANSHIGHIGMTQPIVRTLDCAGVPVDMQVDTGSPVSVITWPTYEQNKAVWPKLRGSPLKLTCFLERLLVRGQLELKVSCGNRSTEGSLQVLGCSGPNLCRRDLIQAFHMLEAPVMNVNTPDRPVPVMAAARIQRWALLLSAYDYVIKHQPGKDNFQQMSSAGSPRQQLLSQGRRKKLGTLSMSCSRKHSMMVSCLRSNWALSRSSMTI